MTATFQACARCGQVVNAARLNVEGRVHHGRPAECLDRRACERARRRASRKRGARR